MNQPISQTGPTKLASGSRILFVSYDGLTDPLGRSQILPYLEGLAAKGFQIHVMSCDKPALLKQSGDAVREICASAGIAWHSIPYHRRPPILSSVFDMARMAVKALTLHDRYRFDLLHCRSYLPALVGRLLKRLRGVPYIFDMRGFWPEERTESGDWDLGNPLYRSVYSFFKNAEASLLEDADQVVSLTRVAAAQIALRRRKGGITVIPCCVDFAHFPAITTERRLSARRMLGIDPDAQVLVYLGSLGGNHLLDEMFAFYREFRALHSNPVFLFVTQTPAEFVAAAGQAQQVPLGEIVVRGADRDEVPALLASADLGVAFKRAEYSSLACSPTKLGEMLAEGIPVVANAGIGDIAEILNDTGGGVAVSDFSPPAFQFALAQVSAVSDVEALRRAALRWFSLADGVESYAAMYRTVISRPAGTQGDLGRRAKSGERVTHA